MEELRLPKGDAERKGLAEEIGADGFGLLRTVEAGDAPARLITISRLVSCTWNSSPTTPS